MLAYAPFAHTASHDTPSLCTYNSRGLAADGQSHDQLRRAKLANLKCLVRQFGVTCIQETHLNPDHNYLQTHFPNAYINCSSKSSRSSGTATIVNPETLKHYSAASFPVPACLAGYVQADVLTPRNHEGPRILFINCYLFTGPNHNAVKLAQLRALCEAQLPRDCLTFMLGDFNFILTQDEATSGSNYYNITKELRAGWAAVRDHFGLSELYQPVNTRYGTTSSGPVSAKLDRIYSNLEELDHELLKPTASLARVPRSILRFDKRTQRFHVRPVPGASDHVPVGVAFHPDRPGDAPPRTPSVPRWVIQDKNFVPEFYKRWNTICDLPSDRFSRMQVFKDEILAASKAVLRLRSNQKKLWLDTFGKINVTLKLLRLARQGELSDATQTRYFHRYEYLTKFTDKDGMLDLDTLRHELNQTYSKGEIDRRQDEAADPAANLPPSPVALDSEAKEEDDLGFDETKRKRRTIIDAIKVLLPSTRSRLPGLREEADGELHTDVAKFCELASGYWSGIWAERLRPLTPLDLDRFCKPITFTDGLTAEIPTVNVILKALQNSGNSCPGPDGIPFAALRALSAAFAPLAVGVIEALAEGELPPAGYNYGLLFLLNKKGTYLPSDTRPISVTNADNRIVAASLVLVITPILDARLDRAQQGFIKNRCYHVHICDLNDVFYSAVEGGEDYFALFMDTAKAFDSIDHDFIHAAVARLGLPGWFRNVVRGLLHLVEVQLFFHGLTDTFIAIHRGVKQGCPLSPLLFALCYDVLLCKLRKCPLICPFAMADDLALGAKSFRHLCRAMVLVSNFRRYSGLGQNMDKTHVLSAQERDLSQEIAGSPWPDMLQAETEVYLGVPFGRELSLADIWEPTVTKITNRCNRYDGALRKMSLNRRITTFNVFIFSMLTYLLMFFPLPGTWDMDDPTLRRLYALARRHIVPWRGTGYKLHHLFHRYNRFGPATPLLDPWARSISMGAARYDLQELDGVHGVPEPAMPTMRIELLNKTCAEIFVAEDLGAVYDDPNPAFKAIDWSNPDAHRRRKTIYDRLVYAQYHYQHQDPDLRKRLKKAGLQGSQEEVGWLHKSFGTLGTVDKNHRNIQFRLTLNALPTLRRGRFFGSDSERPCLLCGEGTGTDHYKHIFFGDCPPVRRARLLFGLNAELDLRPASCGPNVTYAATSLLAFPLTTTNKHKNKAICIFNATVWLTRTYHYASYNSDHRPRQSEVVHRLSMEALYAWERHNKPKISKGLGSASNRTAAQTTAARSYAKRIIEQMDPTGLKVYTDGSACPNPGPCGAGVYLILPSSRERKVSIGLGHGTNNLGELWALGAAISLADREAIVAETLRGRNAYLISDSQYTIGCLTLGWKSKSPLNTEIISAIQRLFETSSFKWHINWVPGHAGVAGNEVADGEAGRGSHLSQQGLGLIGLTQRARDGNFLPG
jgi:ribonuclease HI